MDIPFEKQFHFHDGTAIADLEQLKRKIETISYQEFYRHVNAEKNDFASWVRYVVKDEALAAELQKVGSIVETVELLEDYLHPRPVIASHKDMQSRIEESVIKSPLPSIIDDEPMVVESSKRQSAAPPQSPSSASEPMDLRLIEEKLGLRSSTGGGFTAPNQSPNDLLQDSKVRDELFGTETKAREQLARETQSAPQQSAAPQQPAHHSSPYDSDTTRLIVKDFIYGLLFGLVLGLVLGRIISI